MAILQSQDIDVAILDILAMPEPDGMAHMQRIKDDPKLSHIAVIVVSALDKIDPIVKCVKLGADDYLTKPYEPTLLSARLRPVLTKPGFSTNCLRPRVSCSAAMKNWKKPIKNWPNSIASWKKWPLPTF